MEGYITLGMSMSDRTTSEPHLDAWLGQVFDSAKIEKT
jgi:hypothetical protein